MDPCKLVAPFPNGNVRREEEHDIWALDLTCGHRVERTVHHKQRYWIGTTTVCPECEFTRGVVTAERIVEAANRKKEMERKRATDVAKAGREVAKAEKGGRGGSRETRCAEGRAVALRIVEASRIRRTEISP